MAGNQTDNVTLLDLTTGLIRTVETGGTPDTIQLSTDMELISGANMLVDGDLTVNGTTTTIHSEQVNIRDNHLYLNADYTTAAVSQTGGIVVNVLPTATADTVAAAGFVAGNGGVANPQVTTVGSATFSAGDIIQITGANNQGNDGIFEVLSHIGAILKVKGVGITGTTVPWVVNDFVTDATGGGDIRVVNVNVLEGNSSGNWQTATVSTTTGISYNTITQQGVVDLQEAYEQGNTITTSNTYGDVIIAGTEQLLITATGGIDIDTELDFDGTVFDVQMTGANGFSVAGTATSTITVDSGDLDLGTTTTGDININAVDELDLDAGTTIVIDTADAADASGNDITVTAGSSTGGANAGASIILTPGDGDAAGAAGSVDVTGPNDEDEAVFTLETTGVNGDKIEMFVGDSAPGGAITGLAGSLFFRDTGGSAELYLNTSNGSGNTWTQLSTGAGNSLQQAYVVGNTIVTDATNGDFDVSGTEAISLDASQASNFTVAGAGLTLSTTGSGDVDISAADELDLDAGTTLVGNTASIVDASGNDITFTAGSSTGGGNAGASVILTPGDGDGAGAAGSVDVTGPNDEDEAVFTLETTGNNGDKIEMFVGDSDPSGAISGLAGSLFFRDTAGSAELYLNTSNGSGNTWTQIATGGTVTLQNAYVGGNTITTNATEGDVTFNGTEDFIVGGSVTVDFDTTDAISLDADVASNFTVNGAGLTLSTTTSGDVDISAADELDLDAGSTLVGNTADAVDASGNDITFTAGSSTGGANAGASIVLTPGDGDAGGAAGSVDVTGPNDEDEAVFTLETTGNNGDKIQMFVGDSDPSGAVTGLAGSLFFRDTAGSGELYLNTSNGSGNTWSEITVGGDVTLQVAYENGNTITTNATEGNITFQGTEDFIVGGGVTVDFDTTDAISFDADAASNFTVDSAGLTLSTTTSGDVDISAADELDLDAGSTMVLNTADVADASGNDITVTAGSSTGGGNAGASIILTPGDGNVAGAAGSVDVTGPNDEDEAVFSLETTGNNGDKIEMFVGDSDPSGVVTGLAGSLWFRDTAGSAELYLNTSNGSGNTWTPIATGGTVTLQNAYVGGNTITTNATEGDVTFNGTEDFIVGGGVTVDFDTTDAISLDADVASNFTVDGANLTLSTTTSGTLALTSADDIDVTFESANATAVTFDDDAANNYITLDTTAANQAVELNQFVDIVGSGAGITLTAGENLTAGDVVTIEDTTGDVVKADSNTGTTIDGLCIGVVAIGANDTNPVKVYTVPGSLIPVTFAAAPAANRNGDPVWVSTTAGVATLTPPTASGNVQYIIGILQGADGADTSPLVVYQPQFIAIRP